VLRIFDVFVFVDWYGTLSTARFWDRILLNERHPLATQLREALEDLFRGRKEFVRAWMRGEVPEAEAMHHSNCAYPTGTATTTCAANCSATAGKHLSTRTWPSWSAA